MEMQILQDKTIPKGDCMRILCYVWAIPFILLFAFLDKIIINKGSFLGYIIVCAFEYAIFWLGIY